MIRRIWRFHHEPRLIAIATTLFGRLAIGACALGLLHIVYRFAITDVYLADSYLMAAFAMFGIAFFPGRARQMASLGSLVLVVFYAVKFVDIPGASAVVNLLASLAIAGVALVGFLGLIALACRLESLPEPLRRHPVAVFHAVAITGIVLVGIVPALNFATQLLWLVPFFIWRISYLLLDAARGKIAGTTPADHLFYLLPTFGGSNLAYGKAHDNLSRHETADTAELARTQLSGLRLLAVGLLWAYCLKILLWVVLGIDTGGWVSRLSFSLELPSLRYETLAERWPITLAWIALYFDLFVAVLYTAAYSAIVVGCLRLLGFHVFRNTYRPLLSESLIEFWGRYSYYFKELLLDFFFYPTFLRCAWAGPRLRLFIATLAAAALGNLYFHLLMYIQDLFVRGPEEFFAAGASRAVYSVSLAVGIWVSMLRQQSRRNSSEEPTVWLRTRRIFVVVTFFALIQVFGAVNFDSGLAPRTDFLLALVGL